MTHSISTNTLATIVALVSVGVGSEARGEREAAEATQEALVKFFRRLGIDPDEFRSEVRDAMRRLRGDHTDTYRSAS